MNLLLGKELRLSIVYQLIIVQQCLVWSTRKASRIEQPNQQALNKFSEQNLAKTNIKMLNETIRRLNKSDFENVNLMPFNRTMTNKATNLMFENISLLNNQFKFNVTDSTRPSEFENYFNSNDELDLNFIYKAQLISQPKDVLKDDETKSNKSTFEDVELLFQIPNYLIIILIIFYMSISLAAILGNLLILYIVIKSKKMRNPTNYLLANLSASDFLIGKF